MMQKSGHIRARKRMRRLGSVQSATHNPPKAWPVGVGYDRYSGEQSKSISQASF